MSKEPSMLERLLTPVLERNYGGFNYSGFNFIGTQHNDEEIVVAALNQGYNPWNFTPNFVKQLTKVSTRVVHRTNYSYDPDLFWKVVILHQQAERYFAFERNIASGPRGADHFSRLRSHILGHLGTLYEKAFRDSQDFKHLEKKFAAYEEASKEAKRAEPKYARDTFRIAGVTGVSGADTSSLPGWICGQLSPPRRALHTGQVCCLCFCCVPGCLYDLRYQHEAQTGRAGPSSGQCPAARERPYQGRVRLARDARY